MNALEKLGWTRKVLAIGFALAGVAQAQAADLLINVDTTGCNTNVAINNGVAQSFQVPAGTSLDKIELWIKPELYYTTSYNVELYDGAGTGGVKLGTSPTLTLGSQTGGTASTWYAFPFAGQNINLQANHAYTLKLVRLSQYSGAFSYCNDVYPGGIEYWLTTYAEPYHDMSFRVYGTKLPVVNVDTAGCNTNVAINNGVAQSFQVSAGTSLDRIELWIKPELYYTTSYNVELYDSEGTGGVKLGTSPTLTLGSQTGGTASTWYAFPFTGQNINLQANHAYTLKLVRLSQYSGAFSYCNDVYPGGIEYWLTTYAEPYHDMSFRVY